MKNKNLIPVLAAVLLCTAAAVPAAADELNWTQDTAYYADNSEWAGNFSVFEEIGLKMYLPMVFEADELTPEDRGNGYVAYYVIPENEAAGIGIMALDMEGMEPEYYAQLLSSEYQVTDAVPGQVNGLPMVTYTHPEDPACKVLSVCAGNGLLVEFSFSPIDDEFMQTAVSIMMHSIMDAEQPL